MFITQSALACGDPFSNPVMLVIGIFNPTPFKNSCIALAEACGLAVRTKISLLPLASDIVLANSNKGPFLPSITLSDFLANSVAFNFPLDPLGIT